MVHSDSKSIHCLSLSLESVDDILWGDSLTLGVISVDQRVANNNLEEGLEHFTCLWVDCRRNSLDTSTTSETADGGFCDASEHVFVFWSVFGLSKTFSLTFSRHMIKYKEANSGIRNACDKCIKVSTMYLRKRRNMHIIAY